MKSQRIQLLLCVQHFLVDALCVSCLYREIASFPQGTPESYGALVLPFILYNSLAFCTQWLTGFWCDLLKGNKYIHLGYALLLTAGALLFMQIPSAGIICLGLGNSIFHAAGGKYVIEKSHGRAAPLGAFVAPGALGVYFGSVMPGALWILTVLMVCSSVVLFAVKSKEEKCSTSVSSVQAEDYPHLMVIAGVILVLICISCRAGSGVLSFGKDLFPAQWSFLPVLFVFAGKAAGGYLGDRAGIGKTGVIAFAAGTVLTLFGEYPAAYLAGQFFMNLLMALTLWQLVKLLPKSPGLAFGVAAAVLYPGTLIRFSKAPLQTFLLLAAISFICFVLTQLILAGSSKRRDRKCICLQQQD